MEEQLKVLSPGVKVIVCGLGGQGIIFLTRLLAKTAVAQGYPVLVSETHGMSQRGGSVISHFKVGGSQAPLIRRGTADVLLALDETEGLRNLPFLRPGAAFFVNSERRPEHNQGDTRLTPELLTVLERLAIETHCLPATHLAMQLGSVGVANVVMAGFAAAHPALGLPVTALRQTILNMPAHRRVLNLKALEAGFRATQSPKRVIKE